VLKCLKLSADGDAVQIQIYTKESVIQDYDVESHSTKIESLIIQTKKNALWRIKNINNTKSSGNIYFLCGKVKCTLVQALRLCTVRTANRGSRGIALPFHDHGTRRG
jgi:hypothetical protein